MSVIRVVKDKNFFAASNEPFNDERLSWEARGVMGYLLSKPDDWQVRFQDLVRRGPAGEHKVRRILKELEEHGYLVREIYRTEAGTFDWVSTVYESSTIPRKSLDGDAIYGKSLDGDPTGGDTISRLSTRGSSTRGSSTRGKPRDILNTELINTEEQNIELTNTEEEWTPTPFSQLSAAFVNKTKIPEFTGGAQKWNEAIQRMVKAGVEPNDIVTAIDELKNKNYTIIGIASVENASISAMSKRLTRDGKHAMRDPQSYITGEFADYINH